MPEAATLETTSTEGTSGSTGNQQTQPAGWLAGLPADIRENEAFKPHKTVGDFAKAHLETAKKATDLEAKLKDSIPKLPEDATQEERDVYQMSLGRPEKAEEYEFDGEDKNAPEWTGFWKGEFFKLGLPKSQAKALSTAFNGHIQKMVEAPNAGIQKEITDASTKLKTELGDKYDASVELAARLWKKETDTDFDKAFTGETSANRYTMIRFLLKMAAKTGEDLSPQGGLNQSRQNQTAFVSYDKSPAPPKKG